MKLSDDKVWISVHYVSKTVLSDWNLTNMHLTKILERLLLTVNKLNKSLSSHPLYPQIFSPVISLTYLYFTVRNVSSLSPQCLHVPKQASESISQDLHGILVVLACAWGSRGGALRAGRPSGTRDPRARGGALPPEERAGLLGRAAARRRSCRRGGRTLGRCNNQRDGRVLAKTERERGKIGEKVMEKVRGSEKQWAELCARERGGGGGDHVNGGLSISKSLTDQ